MGEYEHQLDTKGRMIVPSKFRYDLNERFIITRGLDKCLFGYTLEEWQVIEEKMKTLPMTKKMRVNSCVCSFQVLLKWN